MEHLLAIDIDDITVSGVLLELGQKAIVVRSYSVVPLAGKTLTAAVGEVVRQTGYTRGECRVALSPARCFFRSLKLPFRDSRKIDRVLPFELEELTSLPMDEWTIDAIIAPDHGEEAHIFAAMIRKTELLDLLGEIQEAGIDPDVLTISSTPTATALATVSSANQNCILLDIGLKQTTIVLVDKGQPALVRSIGIDAEELAGFSCSQENQKILCLKPEGVVELIDRVLQPLRQTLLSVGRAQILEKDGICFVNGPVGLDGAVYEQLRRRLATELAPCNISKRHLLKVEPVEGRTWVPALLNSALALALWQKKDGPLFNFRRGELKKRRSFGELKKRIVTGVACLAVACAALAGYLALDYSQLAQKSDGLTADIDALFRATLPEVTRIVDPVQQLKVKVDEGRRVYGDGQGSGGLSKLTILAELSARIPESLPVRITRLVNDQSDLRIMAETRDFNTVDNVKRELEKSSLFGAVVISSANLAPRGGGVRFELKVQFR